MGLSCESYRNHNICQSQPQQFFGSFLYLFFFFCLTLNLNWILGWWIKLTSKRGSTVVQTSVNTSYDFSSDAAWPKTSPSDPRFFFFLSSQRIIFSPLLMGIHSTFSTPPGNFPAALSPAHLVTQRVIAYSSLLNDRCASTQLFTATGKIRY